MELAGTNSERNVGYRTFKNELGDCVLNEYRYMSVPTANHRPVETRAKMRSAARADRAKELATKAIEKIIDASAPQPVGLGLSKSAPTERLMAARAFVSAQLSCRRKK
jgi:hypothetical protein